VNDGSQKNCITYAVLRPRLKEFRIGKAPKMTKSLIYPDISDLLARKAKGREAASKKSFAEKIAIVEALNERLAPLKAARGRRVVRLEDFTDSDMALLEAIGMSPEHNHLDAELDDWHG
jgi:hypothetical protein